jgi:two-component system, response regulator PdtaR
MELKETLERFGYRVPTPVKRGEDVPAAIIVNKPDLILMDIRLKGFQDGIETAYIVGGEFEVPFVFLSAYSDDETLGRALGTRAYGYLVKPFDEKTLRTTIELALRRAKEFRERDHNDWYRGILERFPRPVFLTDLYGRISFVNIAAKTAFGMGSENRIGTAIHLLFAAPGEVTDLLGSAGTPDSEPQGARGTLTLKSGKGSAHLDVTPIRGDDDMSAGYVVLVEFK